MAIESKIYQALTTSTTVTGLTASSIYPLKRRQGCTNPSVVFRRAQGTRVFGMSGTYGTLENAVITFDLFTTDTDGRITLSDAVMFALSSATAFKTAIQIAPVDSYDNDLELYSRSFDVSVWNRE
jgi:hypothetical protein